MYIYLCIYAYIQRGTDFKELAHEIRGLANPNFTGQFSRLETQARADAVALTLKTGDAPRFLF